MAQTLFLRSTASAQCVAAAMHTLDQTAGTTDVTTCSVKRAKTIASWQFIPATGSNVTTITDPPSTTPATQGWLFDAQGPGSYANTNWTINLLFKDTVAAGTVEYKAQLFVVTTNGTTVTKVSQIGGLVTSGTVTPVIASTRRTLTITAPGVITLSAGQYLYLEVYLKQTLSSGSTTATSTAVEDDAGGTLQGDIVTPTFTAAVVPGDDSADEGGITGGSFMQTVAAVAMGLALATNARAAQTAQHVANSHQDEIVAQPVSAIGTTGEGQVDLWRMRSNAPRITNLYANDEIVAQVTFPASDDGSPILFSVQRPVVVPEAFPTDELPRITTDESDWIPPFAVARPVALDVAQTQDERVAQPASLGIDEGIWEVPFTVSRPPLLHISQSQDEWVAQPTGAGSVGGGFLDLWSLGPRAPRITHLYADDVIVPQPSGIALDDGGLPVLYHVARDTWMPVPWQYGSSEGSVWGPITEDYYQEPFSVQRRPSVDVSQTQDERVAPSAAIGVDEGAWEPPYTVSRPPATDVSQAQDERVTPTATIALDEGVWSPPCVLLRAPTVEVFQTQAEGVVTPAEIHAFSGDLTVSARFSGELGTFSRFSGTLIVTPWFDGELDTEPK